MIRLLPLYDKFSIEPGETTETLRQRLMQRWGINFTLTLIETSNNRYLPPDEILIDSREYFMVTSYDLPLSRTSA